MAKRKKTNKRVSTAETPVVEIPVPVTENSPVPDEQTTAPAVEITPELPVKSKHAHEYKESCGCARCKKVTAKIKENRQSQAELEAHIAEKLNSEKQTIIDEFIASLDDQDKAIILFSPESKELIGQNIDYIKRNFGEFSVDAVEKLVNAALQAYLKIYIHK